MNSSYKFILWHEPHRVPTSPPPRAPVHAMNNVTIVHVSKTKSWLLLLAKTRPCSTNSSVDNVLHCKNEFLGLHYLMRFFFLKTPFYKLSLKGSGCSEIGHHPCRWKEARLSSDGVILSAESFQTRAAGCHWVHRLVRSRSFYLYCHAHQPIFICDSQKLAGGWNDRSREASVTPWAFHTWRGREPCGILGSVLNHIEWLTYRPEDGKIKKLFNMKEQQFWRLFRSSLSSHDLL